MRLFVAIPLPKPVKDQIGTLKKDIRGLRWQDPSKMHLTLRFIGDVNEDLAGDIREQLGGIERGRFVLSFGKMGHFSRGGFPSVLWIGVEKTDALMNLQSEIEQKCRIAGLEKDARDYKPHITIARNKHADKNKVQTYLGHNSKPGIEGFTADRFVLYSSILHPDGAIHKPLEEFTLT